MTKSKAIGTHGETEVVRAFERAGMAAKRYALKGSGDVGDVHVANSAVVVQVKAGEQTRKPSWNLIWSWWGAAVQQSDRVPECDVALLVLRRWGSGRAEDWTVFIGADDLAWLMRYPGAPAKSPLPLEPVSMRLGNLMPLLVRHYGPRQPYYPVCTLHGAWCDASCPARREEPQWPPT